MNKPIYLIVTTFFPSPNSWRCSFAYDYVRAIEREGRYRPVVFKPGCSYEYEGVKVYGFKAISLPSALPCPFLRTYNVKLFLKAFTKAGFNVEDIVVAEAYTNGQISKLIALRDKNPKIIVAAHHHDPASSGLFDGRFRYFWPIKLLNYFERRQAYELADLHIFISNMVKHSMNVFPDTSWSVFKDYQRLGRGIGFLRQFRLKRQYIMHNGVDVSIFKRSKIAPKKVRSLEFTIGCIGNFISWKSQKTLIEAVSRLKTVNRHFKILFVGSGPERQKCMLMAKSLDVDAEFLEEVKHEELASFYQMLDLFVLPSYFEGFGCVFTEAWASGVPFITCEGQGMEDFIDAQDRSIWLFKPMDSKQLSERIEFFIENQPIQRLVAEVDINKIMSKYLDYIETLKQ